MNKVIKYLHRMLTTVLMAVGSFVAVHAQTLQQLWKNPTNDYRVKTWWFFGYEHTTDEGITADVEELSKAGFGGVVYYDQNHRNAKNLPSGKPDEGFSLEWWHHLRFAASEARRVGLSCLTGCKAQVMPTMPCNGWLALSCE